MTHQVSEPTALELYIPPCIDDHHPAAASHFPPIEKPMRINIEGPLVSIQKLLPREPWILDIAKSTFPQPAGPALARLAYEKIYRRALDPDATQEARVRDEYMGWVTEKLPEQVIDYYGVTFDHRVPEDDDNPEVYQINIIEMDDDEGAYARQWLRFEITPEQWRLDFLAKKVLAVPRCCGKRKGTTDRKRVNDYVQMRDSGKYI